MEITEENIREMGNYLGERGEPRRTAYGNIRHKVPDIMVIGFTATLCNHDEFEGMVGEELEEHDQYYISSGDFCAEE
jgi:hypothetical protein